MQILTRRDVPSCRHAFHSTCHSEGGRTRAPGPATLALVEAIAAVDRARSEPAHLEPTQPLRPMSFRAREGPARLGPRLRGKRGRPESRNLCIFRFALMQKASLTPSRCHSKRRTPDGSPARARCSLRGQKHKRRPIWTALLELATNYQLPATVISAAVPACSALPEVPSAYVPEPGSPAPTARCWSPSATRPGAKRKSIA